MLYHIRDFVTDSTLAMLYYNFVYSRITYGITAWGTASRNFLREVKVKQNNIIRTITWNKTFFSCQSLIQTIGDFKISPCVQIRTCKIYA